MAVDDRILFYGAAIMSDTPRFFGAAIMSIVSNNYFNGDIQVIDAESAPIAGATVTIISTQTNPAYYIGDISGSTDSNGIFSATGSSTTGTTLTIEADGYTTYTGPLVSTEYDYGMTVVLSQGGKKIWNTNKGNIMFNPDDTILIEIS